MKRYLLHSIVLVTLIFGCVTEIACGSYFSGVWDWRSTTLSTLASRDGDTSSMRWCNKLLIGSAAVVGLGWAYWKWKQPKAPIIPVSRPPTVSRQQRGEPLINSIQLTVPQQPNQGAVPDSSPIVPIIDFSLVPSTSPKDVPGTTLHVQKLTIEHELKEFLHDNIPQLVIEYLERQQQQVLNNCYVWANLLTDSYVITRVDAQNYRDVMLYHIPSTESIVLGGPHSSVICPRSWKIVTMGFGLPTMSSDGTYLVFLDKGPVATSHDIELCIRRIFPPEQLSVGPDQPGLRCESLDSIRLDGALSSLFTFWGALSVGFFGEGNKCAFVGEYEVAVFLPYCDAMLQTWNIHTRTKMRERSFQGAVVSLCRQFPPPPNKREYHIEIVDRDHLICGWQAEENRCCYAIIDAQGAVAVRFMISGNATKEKLKMLDGKQVAVIDYSKKVIKIFKLSDDYSRIIDQNVMRIGNYSAESRTLADVSPSGMTVIYPQQSLTADNFNEAQTCVVQTAGYDVR